MANQSDIKLNIAVTVTGQQSLSMLSASIMKTNAAQAGAASAANRTSKAMAGQKTQLTGLAARLEMAETRYDALYRASYRLQIVGYQLIGAGTNMIGMVKSLTDEWGKFEFTVNRAAGALQIWKNVGGAVNPIYTALIEKIQQTTKELRLFPAADVAKATYFWASTSGQAVVTMRDLESVMKSVNPLMKIAALTQTGYEAAIKGVYSIIVQYGKSLSDVGDVTNKLFLVTQRTALEFPDLINSFKMVGPVAASLGISFEDVANVLGQLGDAGIRGTQSGRALRQVFIKLVHPTAAAAKTLDAVFTNTKGLGKTFDEIVFPNGRFIGLTGYIHALAFAMKDATIASKGQLLASITTANELPVLTALVNNEIKVIKQIPGAYDTAKGSVSNAANAADQFRKSWELLSGSWQGITGRITAGIEVIRLKIGQQLAEALKPTVDKVRELLDGIEKWVSANPKIVEAIGKMMGTGAAILIVAGAILVVIGSLLGLYSAISVIALGFGSLIVPLGAAVVLIGTFGAAIVRNWSKITRTVIPAIEKFKKGLADAGFTTDNMKASWDKAYKSLSKFMDSVIRVGLKVFKSLLDLILAIARSPLKDWIAALAPPFIALLLILKTYITVVGGLVTLWGGMVKLFVMIIAPIRAVITAVQGLAIVFVAAGRGVAGFRAVLSLLSATTIVGIIVALAGALFLVSQISFDRTKQQMKDLADRIETAKSHTEDLLSAMGSIGKVIGPDIEAMISAMTGYDPELARLTTEINRLSEAQSRAKGAAAGHFQQLVIQAKLDRETLIANHTEVYAAALDNIAKSADTAGISQDAYARTVYESKGKLVDSYAAAGIYAADYYKILDGGEMTVEKSIELYRTLAKQGVKIKLSPEAFLKQTVSSTAIKQYVNDFNAKIALAQARTSIKEHKYSPALEILNQLKADSTQYSDAIGAQISDMLSTIPENVKNIMTTAQELADKGPSEIAAAVIAGVAKIKDFKKNLKDALKQTISPVEFIKGLIGDVTSKDLRNAFNSNLIGAQAIAEEATAGLVDALGAALAAAQTDPASLEAMRVAIQGKGGKGGVFSPAELQKAIFGNLRTFKGVALTPEQQVAITSMLDSLFPEIAALDPTPAVVAATGATLTAKVGALLETSFMKNHKGSKGKGSSTDPALTFAGSNAIATAVAGMTSSWASAGVPLMSGINNSITSKLSPNMFVGGYNTLSSWFRGIKYAADHYGIPLTDTILTGMARKFIGKSPPPDGPLKDINKGGYNIMKAWAGGISSGGIHAVRAASGVASQLSDSLQIERAGLNATISHDTTQSRRIAVDVNVTSPDGSVGRIDMTALAGALSGSALTRSLEQASAVR